MVTRCPARCGNLSRRRWWTLIRSAVFRGSGAQGHRPGLHFLVSTGRHPGTESMEEARLLLALDFAGNLIDVVSQPMRLRFDTAERRRSHTPDFLAVTRSGVWLIDVRPEHLIREEDLESFAA